MHLIDIMLGEAKKQYQQYPDDYKPNFQMDGANDFKVGGTRLPVGTSFYSDEEKMEFKQAVGVSPVQLPDVPVIYGYEMLWGNAHKYGTTTTPEMDMIKARKKYEGTFDKVQPSVNSAMQYFVSRMFDPNMVKTSNTNRQPATALAAARLITSNRPKIIIPLPSSSPLVEEIATSLASALNKKGISATIRKNMVKQIPKIAWSKVTDKSSVVHFERPEDFQIKNMQRNAGVSNGQAYYGWIGVTPIDIPEGTDVILVDDNIVSGQTMKDAIKSLFVAASRIVPVAGLALHQFRGRDEETDGPYPDETPEERKARLDHKEKLRLARIDRNELKSDISQASTPKKARKMAASKTLGEWIRAGLFTQDSLDRWLGPPEPKMIGKKPNPAYVAQQRKRDLERVSVAALRNTGKMPDLDMVESAEWSLIADLLYS